MTEDRDRTEESAEHGEAGPTLGRRLIRGDSYVLVLFLLTVTYLATSLLSPSGIGGLIVVTTTVLTMLAALRTSWTSGRTMRIAAIGGAVAIAGTVASLVLNDATMPRVVPLVVILMLLVTPFAIGRRLIRHPRVTYETVAGAVDVYVLIGLIFAALYRLMQVFGSAPFFVQVSEPTSNQTLYFSYVTLATLGYGDLTPATNLGRTVVVIEAMLGQVFLITAVARAVSMLEVGRRR